MTDGRTSPPHAKLKRLRRGPRSAARRRAWLVEQIVTGVGDLDQLASELGVSLDELARITQETGALEQVVVLNELMDLRAQILLGRYRASAAVLLIELLRRAQQPEDSPDGASARQAAMDLLKATVPPRRGGSAGGLTKAAVGVASGSPSASEAREILAALERMGRDDEQS